MKTKNMPATKATPADASGKLHGWLKGQGAQYQPRHDYGQPDHDAYDVVGEGEGEDTGGGIKGEGEIILHAIKGKKNNWA